MKTVIISVVLFLASVFLYKSQAQEKNSFYFEMGFGTTTEYVGDVKKRINQLETHKNKIEKLEKDKLREEVEEINERLENNEITATEAADLKKKAAEKRALNIQNQMNIIDENIALLKRNVKVVEKKGQDEQEIDKYYTSLEFLKYEEGDEVDDDYDSIPKRTYSNLFVAFGLNNALIENQSLDDSPYKIGGSRFFEIGYEFETVLSKNGFFRIKYGLAFQFNGLKADDNQYFVEDGDQTVLEEFQYPVDKAKLRMDNLVFPVHFVFGPSTITYDKKRAHYNTDHFKVGLGGYAGVNLNTIQKLKYEENGKDRKDKLSQSYNTNNFIYGLSAFIGYDNIGLYVKYDVNTIFKDNPVDQNNISVGLRVGI